MKPRFKVGDLIKGTYDFQVGEEVMLIIAMCSYPPEHPDAITRYRLVVGDKIVTLNSSYVDQFMELCC